MNLKYLLALLLFTGNLWSSSSNSGNFETVFTSNGFPDANGNFAAHSPHEGFHVPDFGFCYPGMKVVKHSSEAGYATGQFIFDKESDKFLYKDSASDTFIDPNDVIKDLQKLWRLNDEYETKKLRQRLNTLAPDIEKKEEELERLYALRHQIKRDFLLSWEKAGKPDESKTDRRAITKIEYDIQTLFTEVGRYHKLKGKLCDLEEDFEDDENMLDLQCLFQFLFNLKDLKPLYIRYADDMPISSSQKNEGIVKLRQKLLPQQVCIMNLPACVTNPHEAFGQGASSRVSERETYAKQLLFNLSKPFDDVYQVNVINDFESSPDYCEAITNYVQNILSLKDPEFYDSKKRAIKEINKNLLKAFASLDAQEAYEDNFSDVQDIEYGLKIQEYGVFMLQRFVEWTLKERAGEKQTSDAS